MTLYDNVTQYDNNFLGECLAKCAFCTMINVQGSLCHFEKFECQGHADR